MHMIDVFYMYMLHISYTWDKEKSDGKTDCDSWEIFKGVLRWHFWGYVWTDSIKCIDDLQKNGELSQSQENNKLTNLKARVSSLSFRISMKTCMPDLRGHLVGYPLLIYFTEIYPNLYQCFISLWYWNNLPEFFLLPWVLHFCRFTMD